MPESWTAVTWGEVAKKEIFKVATTSLVEKRVAGVLNAGRGMFDRGPVGEFDTNYEFFHEVRAGQLVVRKLTAWEGPVTVVAPEFDGYVCSPEFPTFTLDADRLAPSYARLLCQRPDFWSQILAVSTGSVLRRKRVSPAALLSLPIVLPPLEEQRRIVDLVGAIETYIDSLETQIETTRTARSALLAELLSNPGDDWQETTLGEISQQGLLTDGDWVESKDQDQSGGNRLLQLADVGDGVFLDKSDRWMNDEQFSRLNCTPVEVGDILIARMPYPIARACQVPENLPRSCVAVDVAICRPPQAIADPKFLVMLINDWRFRSAAESRATGTTRKRVSRKNLAAIAFNLPSPVEQRRIVDLVGSIDEQISSLESQVESVRALRSGVLSELLSGERLLDESYDVAVRL